MPQITCNGTIPATLAPYSVEEHNSGFIHAFLGRPLLHLSSPCTTFQELGTKDEFTTATDFIRPLTHLMGTWLGVWAALNYPRLQTGRGHHLK
jgi:hypothetical protein